MTKCSDPDDESQRPDDGWPRLGEGAQLDEADILDLRERLAMTPMERLLALEQAVHEMEQLRRARISTR